VEAPCKSNAKTSAAGAHVALQQTYQRDFDALAPQRMAKIGRFGLLALFISARKPYFALINQRF
jgi:hypothetical protein